MPPSKLRIARQSTRAYCGLPISRWSRPTQPIRFLSLRRESAAVGCGSN